MATPLAQANGGVQHPWRPVDLIARPTPHSLRKVIEMWEIESYLIRVSYESVIESTL